MKEIRCGKITASIANEVIYEIGIFAKNSIRKKGIWDYFEEVGHKFLENNLEIIIEKSA